MKKGVLNIAKLLNERELSLSVILIPIAFLFSSCMKDDFAPRTEFSASHDGIFIPCEGNFMYGNASLSYYDKKTKTIENQVFFRANGFPVGDVLQSVAIYDSLAYLVVNNSGKIYVINKDTFKYSNKITGLTSPRYIHFLSPHKAYVTDMYSRSISVVNPQTCMVEKTINIDDGSGEYYRNSSEQLIVLDSLVFVNCWSYDDKILVINSKTDEVINRIPVLKQPRRMVVDKNKKLWVICDGGNEWSEFHGDAGLVKIDAQTQSVLATYLFEIDSFASEIAINGRGDTIYYLNNHVYRFQVDSEVVDNEIFLENPKELFYYGLAVDPINSDVYVADAVDYMQSGYFYRFSVSGTQIDKHKVGVNPNGFCFR